MVGCADGRGDEKQWAQRSQVHVDTSHALSLLYNIPSIHELEPLRDPEKVLPPPLYYRSCSSVGSEDYIYDPDSVPFPLKMFSRDISLRSDSRVWSVQPDIEVEFSTHREQDSVTEFTISDATEVDTIDTLTADTEIDAGAVAGLDIRKITKPLDYQILGKPVFEDKEPNSHRAQRPWAVIHMREATENIRELMKTVIEPQVVNLKDFRLSANQGEELDFRTEYMTVTKVSNDNLKVEVVQKEAGVGGVRKVDDGIEERKVRDLRKPVLCVAQEGGCITALSVDFQFNGMDSKLVEILNERTGA